MICEHRVEAITGKEIEIAPDSMCVHGDNPMAVAFVKEVRKAFDAAGIQVRRMRD